MSDYEGGDAGIEGFFAWKDRYVNGGKQKWGRGNCFEFCSRGICFGCDYNHPQLRLRVTAAGVEARLSAIEAKLDKIMAKLGI